MRGLAYEDEFGVNPFKFGVVGSTDSHTGLSTAQEDNVFGKITMVEPTADPIRIEEQIAGRFTPDDPSDNQIVGDSTASGLCCPCGRERKHAKRPWDAMKRKEIFATTDTRLRVRVFGGLGFRRATSLGRTSRGFPRRSAPASMNV